MTEQEYYAVLDERNDLRKKVATLETENQKLFDRMTRAEELNNELSCTVQDLNEKYGNHRV